MKILLGFEVGTGKEVWMENHHTVVTGMTQLSGKTTCLEGLVERGGVKAVAFLTKRGESGFLNQREIQPYFKEQKRARGNLIDWQYVEAILEATMGERMKFERSWIINACKGAHSLQEVYENIKREQEDARRPLDQSIYTNLGAYFEIILPEIKRYSFADELVLTEGFNVLNLIGMADEMQQLVIESVLSYVLTKLNGVVVVIPEAHKFIPQGTKTPVKGTALRFIREGAAVNNFMWTDTQETTSTDKAVLKQCSNWIMGYQQEKNEVANVRENIGRRKIKEEDIMTLKLGHFIASLQQKIYHVYVLPAGIDPSMGKDVALGKIPVETVKRAIQHMPIVEQKPTLIMRKLTEEETDEVEQLFKTDMLTPVEEDKKYIIEGRELKAMMDELADKTLQIEDVEKLTLRMIELREKVDDTELRLEKLQYRNEERVKENQMLEAQIGEIQKDKDTLMKTVERQGEELSLFRAFKILLSRMIEPTILEATNEEIEKIRKDIAQLHARPTATRKRAPRITGETQIPWVNIWLDKLGGAEQKIIHFMAQKFPLKMTKSQVALGVGLTAKGGYFSGAWNSLKKNKLIVSSDKENYTLAEGPP